MLPPDLYNRVNQDLSIEVDIILKDIDVLRELSTDGVNLTKIARKYGVSKQAVLKHVKRLVEKGLIVKSRMGQYELSDKGRSLLEYAPRVKVEDLNNMIEWLDKGIDYFLSRSEQNTSEGLGSYFVFYALHSFIVMGIASVANASLEVNEKNVNEKLEVLWRDWLKPILWRLVGIMLASSEVEWEVIEAFFNTEKNQGLVYARILDKHLISSRERGNIESNKPLVS
jgi:predicted transcriptional regulator